MRFLAAQLDAYLRNDLWLTNSAHANAMAARLGAGLATVPGANLVHPIEANEIFVELPENVIRGLVADGFQVRRWLGDNHAQLRLVASFNTPEAHVDAFIASALRHSARGPSTNRL
jgi:threonine aldolase